ncbi:MAG: GNAT family N-acetyltransferase [Pseudomonadota bacterium]
MVEFREIADWDELHLICALKVAPEQDGYVSPNVMTMAEAPFEVGSLVRAIWNDGQPIGLLAMKRPSDYPAEEDIQIRRDAAYVWRLMVDQDFQGQGFGVHALNEAKRTAIDWGYDAMTLTAGDGPHSAIPFYKRYGFVLTGRTLWGDEGELEMICQITE